MLLRNRHGHPSREGATLDHVRLNVAITYIAFGGRRRDVYTRITALSGARPGDRVLDIGCGGGYLARLLAAAVAPGGQVTGLDTSAPAIGYARKRAAANCSFVLGVAQDLPWPDGSFDVVASTLAAHHIPDTARQDAFGEMYRVLRPGGALLVADFRPSRRRHSSPAGTSPRSPWRWTPRPNVRSTGGPAQRPPRAAMTRQGPAS